MLEKQRPPSICIMKDICDTENLDFTLVLMNLIWEITQNYWLVLFNMSIT